MRNNTHVFMYVFMQYIATGNIIFDIFSEISIRIILFESLMTKPRTARL